MGKLGSDTTTILTHREGNEDIKRAFKSDDSYTCSLIISTALEMSNEFKTELDKLCDKTKKVVGALVGEELAKWFLKYGI